MRVNQDQRDDRVIRRLDHPVLAVAVRIQAVLHAAYLREAELIGAADFPPLRRSAADIAQSAGTFYGSFRGPELLGVVEVERGAREGSTTIASLGVDPPWFRQGVGSSLVEFVLASCAGAVSVATGCANRPALGLYQRLGFGIVASEVTAEGIAIVHLEYSGRL